MLQAGRACGETCVGGRGDAPGRRWVCGGWWCLAMRGALLSIVVWLRVSSSLAHVRLRQKLGRVLSMLQPVFTSPVHASP